MFIPSNDCLLYSTAFGNPSHPAVLGIGGWIGSWELWAEPFAQLSRSYYTLAYDHRGSGATVSPLDAITFPALVEDVFTVLDAYGVKRAVLAAESAGVAVALGAALKNPERISGLVVVDGMVYNGTPDEADQFLIGLRTHYTATLDAFVDACVPETGCEHIKRWGRQIIDRALPEAAVALYIATKRVDLRPDLANIRQPVLILHGSADRLVPEQASRQLAQTLPHARFELIDGAGHVPTMTRPDVVARAMLAFIPQVGSTMG